MPEIRLPAETKYAAELTALADNDIPDGDGISLLMKYATGMIPGKPGNSPTTLTPGGNKLTLSFNRLNPAPAAYVVEASSDLTSWTAIATLAAGESTWTGNVIETGTGVQRTVTVTDTVAVSVNQRRFLRLRVIR